MVKQRSKSTPRPSPYTKVDEYVINGRNLTSGQTEVTVSGVGRCVFHHHVTNPRTGAEWLDVWFPGKGEHAGQWKSVAIDRVTTVHRTVTRKGAES